MACLSAAALIALCVGYKPSPGETVTVTHSCVDRFSDKVRLDARACARSHRVFYVVRN